MLWAGFIFSKRTGVPLYLPSQTSPRKVVTLCPWDKFTCEAAAAGGHLEVLRWARANGARWDEKTRAVAAQLGYVE
jgi:hypothetical protein